MNNDSYITIQAWMREELNLSGNELLTYAIIYGFSQDGVSQFSGSRQYIADWCGCTVRQIQNILNSLVAKQYITKEEFVVNGVKHCKYAAVRGSEKISLGGGEKISLGSEKISLYNIDNNINNKKVISKDITPNDYESHAYSAEDFLCSAKKTTKGKNLFSKCVVAIDEFTDLPDLHEALVQYLKFRLEVKDKPLYGINQWKGMLKKLDKAVEECHREYIDVVQQSIDKQWLTFYPITDKPNQKKSVFSEYGETTCEKVEEEYVGTF